MVFDLPAQPCDMDAMTAVCSRYGLKLGIDVMDSMISDAMPWAPVGGAPQWWDSKARNRLRTPNG